MRTNNIIVPTHVGPSKLEVTLSYCKELDDENKQRVILITDINKLIKLLGGKPIAPELFYVMYDYPIYTLEMLQYHHQVAWNTEQYKSSIIQGSDF